MSTATTDRNGEGRHLLAATDLPGPSAKVAAAIKRFRVVAGPFAVGDELTPTQKLRRRHVLAKLADEVEALYTS